MKIHLILSILKTLRINYHENTFLPLSLDLIRKVKFELKGILGKFNSSKCNDYDFLIS